MREPDAGWPPDLSAKPLLIARSYIHANQTSPAATQYLLLAILERLDAIEARLPYRVRGIG